jgi:hypothetical protein
MPRFFFHVIDGYSDRDDEGTELPDIFTAQDQAVKMTGEILRDLGAKIWNGAEWSLEVTDESGETLFILRFSAEEFTRGRVPTGS